MWFPAALVLLFIIFVIVIVFIIISIIIIIIIGYCLVSCTYRYHLISLCNALHV